MTVPKARHRYEPEPSPNLQKTSYARFLQLDKTTEEKQPVQSQSGLRQAPRGLGKRNMRKPAENTPKGKSRIGQD